MTRLESTAYAVVLAAIGLAVAASIVIRAVSDAIDVALTMPVRCPDVIPGLGRRRVRVVSGETVVTPTPVDLRADDDDLSHFVCCDADRALCGARRQRGHVVGGRHGLRRVPGPAVRAVRGGLQVTPLSLSGVGDLGRRTRRRAATP